MPPDFEQIARQILTTLLTFSSASEVSIAYAVPQLAEQLRQVWNARGAADLAKLKAARDDASESGYRSLTELDRELRTLDR